MSQWKYNDVILEIDIDDVEFQEKYENAFNKMEVTEKELQKVGTLSGFTKEYCQMFYQLFDNIFGPETGNKLFEGKYNCRIIEAAYDSFIAHCTKEVDAANKRRANTLRKYKVAKKR